MIYIIITGSLTIALFVFLVDKFTKFAFFGNDEGAVNFVEDCAWVVFGVRQFPHISKYSLLQILIGSSVQVNMHNCVKESNRKNTKQNIVDIQHYKNNKINKSSK